MNKQMSETLKQGDNTPVVLIGSNGEVEITSIELLQLINTFRAEEENKTEKQHKEMLRDIRNEIETLEQVGINQRNFALVTYTDKKGEERPCYKLNKAGVLQMLNKESAVVRYKTVCYIEKLEKKNKQLKKDSYMIEDPIERAKAWIIEQEERKALQLENKQQQQIIGELKPKADYTDRILKSKSLMTITAIAKDYGMSGNELNNKLHELGVQYKQGKQWLLYSKYHACRYTHSETISYKHKSGLEDTVLHTKWTQKGRLFLYELLKRNNILPMIERG